MRPLLGKTHLAYKVSLGISNGSAKPIQLLFLK